ncbi:hypothetical protein TrCOL_g8873 [Triparma columacea]|uniref:1-(5-phosphoribosyl)-5-[(5-phosphoribosylamino)methylideneamino]imidazole-4-carboxamideisomerase n=1 Tax=Triparma columacea TaxID=722753 RepID=A0A9W7GPR8_9STRA|nr:hypothetical protein TrCOL_g8873 [Triparma columacea]
MKFRPCIDLHQGSVKQIVGSTLKDSKSGENDAGQTNFTSSEPASKFASMYRTSNLTGGHVIMLGSGNTPSAKSALSAYPNNLQIGGGINSGNAMEWIESGASHVIVTSWLFRDGKLDYDRLKELRDKVGKDRIVIDLSCRRMPSDPTGPYYVVTDRWQVYTDVPVSPSTLEDLSEYCDEFLVHGVENEGKRCGILEDLVTLLGEASPIPVTYAGGVSELEDLDRVKELGGGKVDLTIGSALDCFGGDIKYDDVVEWHRREQEEGGGT